MYFKNTTVSTKLQLDRYVVYTRGRSIVKGYPGWITNQTIKSLSHEISNIINAGRSAGQSINIKVSYQNKIPNRIQKIRMRCKKVRINYSS